MSFEEDLIEYGYDDANDYLDSLFDIADSHFERIAEYGSSNNSETDSFHMAQSPHRYTRFVTNDKWGVKNELGEITIPCEYDYLDVFSNSGYAIVCKNDKYGLLNYKNEIIIPINNYKIERGSLIFGNDIYKITIKIYFPLGSSCGPIGHVECFVNLKGIYIGKCNYRGIPIEDKFLPNMYSCVICEANAKISLNGKMFVKKGEKWGILDSNMNLIIPCEFDSLNYISSSIIIASKDKRYGVYSVAKDREILPFIYDYIFYTSSEELACKRIFIAQKNTDFLCFDYDGKVITPLSVQTKKGRLYFTVEDNGNNWYENLHYSIRIPK